MRRLPPRALVLLALPLAALAACGDDDGGSAAPEEPGTVLVVDNEFNPNDIQVSAGDTVTWRFEGAAVHNVTFDDDAYESSENMKEGTFETTFEEAGSFTYNCTLHPGMDGTVTVTG